MDDGDGKKLWGIVKCTTGGEGQQRRVRGGKAQRGAARDSEGQRETIRDSEGQQGTARDKKGQRGTAQQGTARDKKWEASACPLPPYIKTRKPVGRGAFKWSVFRPSLKDKI